MREASADRYSGQMMTPLQPHTQAASSAAPQGVAAGSPALATRLDDALGCELARFLVGALTGATTQPSPLR